LYHVKQHMSISQRYLVVWLVGLGLPLTVTIRVSRVSAMVSVRFSGIWDRRLQVCQEVTCVLAKHYPMRPLSFLALNVKGQGQMSLNSVTSRIHHITASSSTGVAGALVHKQTAIVLLKMFFFSFRIFGI